MDLLKPGMGVSVEEAQGFIEDLVPLSPPEPPRISEPALAEIIVEDSIPGAAEGSTDADEPDTNPSLLAASARIDIQNGPSLSRSSSVTRHANASAVYGTFRSGLTSFHTPSSSFSDTYASACSSPLPGSRHESPARVRKMSSLASTTTTTSSSSAITITPSLFTRGQRATTPPTPLDAPDTPELCLPDPPELGPKLFFTSAKTGLGVSEVFEYIALRVLRKLEYEEAVEARTSHITDASDGDTVRLGLADGGRKRKAPGACCGQ
jgi:Ras-related protein Rab-7A